MERHGDDNVGFHDAEYEQDSPHSSSQSYDLDNPAGSETHTGEASGTAGAPSDQSTHTGKRRRACEACRRLKVQCNFESSKSETCKRCLKAGRRCIVMERRRRQVIANSVTELEKKLEALTATLKAIKAGPAENRQEHPPGIDVNKLARGEPSGSILPEMQQSFHPAADQLPLSQPVVSFPTESIIVNMQEILVHGPQNAVIGKRELNQS